MRRTACVAAALVLTPLVAFGADADALLGKMKKAMDPGEDLRAEIDFVIVNKAGEEIHWTGEYFRKGDVKRFVLHQPPDLRGTEVVARRVERELDMIRMYVPYLRRVRTIRKELVGEPFLGTDFSFEQLGFEELGDETHEIAGQGKYDGRSCTKIVSRPKRVIWYSKIVRCVDDKDYLPRLVEYYDVGGQLYQRKTLENVMKIQSYPTPTAIQVESVQTGGHTTLRLDDVRYDTGLDDSLFELRGQLGSGGDE